MVSGKTWWRRILFFEKCKLKLEADTDYFKQIVQARVLHLLWMNLKKGETTKTEDKPAYLECHVSPFEK
jgi:methylmalonyl-CoA mutase N-terminal domain/subunit